MTELRISANNLLRKHGFSDGSILEDWYWYTYDQDPDVLLDDVLEELINLYLLPVLKSEGYNVTLTRVESSHNPIRAEYINRVDVYDWDRDNDGEYFSPEIFVDVTQEQIEHVIAKHRR